MLKYSREEKYSKPESAKEILILAREREKSSLHFYEDMLKHSFSEDIKNLIEELKNEELGHIIKIEKKLGELSGS